MKRNESGRRSAFFQSFDRPRRTWWQAGRKRMAVAVAAITWSLPAVAIAEQPCDVYIPSCGAGLCDCGHCGSDGGHSAPREMLACGCGNSHRKTGLMNNPLYRTLDTVAGGIEHVLGLDRCGNSACDSGSCDVAPWSSISPMMEGAVEYAAPVMPRLPKVPSMQDLPDAPEVRENAEDATPQRLPAPQPHSAPSEAASPKPIQPRPVRPKAPEMSPPRIVPSQPRQPELLPEPQPSEPQPSKPRLKPIEPQPELILPEEEPKKESPFDALEDLNDPFSDDAARLRLPYDPARPASSRTSGGRASGGRTDADRPITSGPIGSGLRTVNHEEVMRLKPLGAPAGLRPLGGGKTLAPYRVSRQR